MNTKFTKGPLTARMSNEWPWKIETVDSAGEVVFTRPLPCHSSDDKSADAALRCLNFDAKDRERCAEINARAFADEHVRASAPELYAALDNLTDEILLSNNVASNEFCSLAAALAALKKARGEA
jgi:hypothetical protein